MAIQDVKLGTQPSGAGGDTNRSANVKVNENFSNPLHAASRMVGTAKGEVSEYSLSGISGLGYGGKSAAVPANQDFMTFNWRNGWYSLSGTYINAPLGTTMSSVIKVSIRAFGSGAALVLEVFQGYRIYTGFCASYTSNADGSVTPAANIQWQTTYTTSNTTKDSNGFLKAASPVIQLYAISIKPNPEAAEQNPIFEKVGTGHYLIKGTQGFATEGWWIEVPADTNGNKICAVQYQTLENGDLGIKTFKKKLNDEGDIIPNLDAPIDIPDNANGEPRWIDIRLNSLPAKPIVEQVPRTKKQAKMVKQIKYAPQLTYITKMEDLIDDEGNPVIVKGKPFQAPVSYVHSDQNGTLILTNQPVINEQGENVFEFVQMVDAEGQPVFEDVLVLDADGNQVFDEVIHEPE